jgi:hypothetical protein
MKRISLGRIFPLTTLALLAILPGCTTKTEAPWEKFAETSPGYQATPNSGRAWDDLLIAADSATKAAEKYSNKADLRDVEIPAFVATTKAAADQAARAATLPAQFSFIPHDPFLPRPHHRGITVIGTNYGYQIQTAGQTGAANSAATSIIAAHRLATVLSHGDAQDAMLGHWIAANARTKAATLIHKMDASTLNQMGETILASLEQLPSPNQTVENELKNMRLSVQVIQDAYREKQTELLHKAFYKQAAPAIEHLQNLRASDRPDYFKNFAAEANQFAEIAKAELAQPVAERKPRNLNFSGERPWRRFSQHLFTIVLTYVDSHDQHLTRSRLFALTCLALAAGKSTGLAPKQFNTAPKAQLLDPFSGQPFPYQTAEREFKIYSVGKNGRDDGGETNALGLEPDLVIEPPEQN